MSILKIASLVVTPNAYEESKILAVVPSNGSGDLDFVRASTKTRVNSEGFISDTCKNLLSYSSNLSNAVWQKFNTVVTFNEGISPDGLNNAVKIKAVAGAAQNIVMQAYNSANDRTHVRTVWAKTVSGTGFTNLMSHNNNANSLFLITNEWQRFEINLVSTVLPHFYVVDFRAAGNTLTEILIWGPQAEIGPSATSYLPTTDRLNVPSIDYTDKGCPSILLEPQRTNLAIFSQNIDNTAWSKTQSSVIVDTHISIDGNLNADTLVSTATNFSLMSQVYSLDIKTYTYSIFAKKINLDFVVLKMDSSPFGFVSAWFDISNGTIGTVGSGVVANIQSYINGYYRLSITFTMPSAGNQKISPHIALGNNSTATSINSSTIFFGAQLEEGSFATSYIPTQASAVTRLQDQLIKTGISSLIGQTEGVFFIESAALVKNDVIRAVTLTDGTTNNRIQIRYEGSNNSIFFVFQSNGGFVTVIARTVVDITQFLKLAIRYSANEVSIFINGVKVITNNTIVLPLNLNKLSFDSGTGALHFNTKVNSLLLFKTYLSDDEMQLLGLTSYNTYQEMATALNYVTQ
jgi:hypothetical protein